VNDVLIAIREYLSGADDAGLQRVIDAPASEWRNVFFDLDGGTERCLIGHVRDITADTFDDAVRRMMDDMDRGELGVSVALTRAIGGWRTPFPPALVSNIHAIASEILTTRALAGVTDERATVEV
jgi:hypothetical protein